MTYSGAGAAVTSFPSRWLPASVMINFIYQPTTVVDKRNLGIYHHSPRSILVPYTVLSGIWVIWRYTTDTDCCRPTPKSEDIKGDAYCGRNANIGGLYNSSVGGPIRGHRTWCPWPIVQTAAGGACAVWYMDLSLSDNMLRCTRDARRWCCLRFPP